MYSRDFFLLKNAHIISFIIIEYNLKSNKKKRVDLHKI